MDIKRSVFCHRGYRVSLTNSVRPLSTFRPVVTLLHVTRNDMRSRKLQKHSNPSPSLSMSGSQASPRPSPSVSSWLALATVGQLSQASPLSSPTGSESSWSALLVRGQLSWKGTYSGVILVLFFRSRSCKSYIVITDVVNVMTLQALPMGGEGQGATSHHFFVMISNIIYCKL